MLSYDESIKNYYLNFCDNYYVVIKNENIINANEISLNLSIPPILDSRFSYIHYSCPKCHKFPFIEIIDKKSIFYTCSCEDRNRKEIKIIELFEKENKFLTFFDVNDNLNSKVNDINKFEGLKCIHYKSHNINETKKFKYY